MLLNYFLEEAAGKLSRKKPRVPPELLSLLETYHFPGNIRELRSMILDAVTQSSKTLSLTPLKKVMGLSREDKPVKKSEKLLIFTEKLPTLKQATELLIEEAIERAGGNQSIAAGLLGMSHQALNQRFRRKQKK